VGAVYAQKYPERTDRWVLDSLDDPDPRRVARRWLANAAQGAEDRFPDFAAWAGDPARETEGLRLAEKPEDVRPLFRGRTGSRAADDHHRGRPPLSLKTGNECGDHAVTTFLRTWQRPERDISC
jgi:pimeloyl-ACP methyl ester carboxylesterase